MTARKKTGAKRKLKLGKQTVKDLGASRAAGRGAKGGRAGSVSCLPPPVSKDAPATCLRAR